MPKISVIVPVFNAEKSLARCAQSLLSQSFEDIEILLVDDGSTDSSAEICDEFASRDGRVKVFHNENRGVSFTRNYGIENSSGEYIMFCDSDDYVESDWCLEHYNAIESCPSAWIVSGERSFYPDGREEVFLPSGEGEMMVVDVKDYFYVFKFGVSGYPWNHIYSKKNLVGIRYNHNVNCGEDVLFNNEYLSRCEKIVCINKPLYNYVREEGTLSNVYDSNYFYTHKILYESRKPYIVNEHMPEFCKIYFWTFVTGIQMIFDKRNKLRFSEKISQSNKILEDPTFIECMEKADLSDENAKFIRLLKSGSYFRVYLFQRIYSMKKKITKGR